MPNIRELLGRARLPNFNEIKSTISALDMILGEKIGAKTGEFENRFRQGSESALAQLRQKQAEAEASTPPPFFGDATPTATPQPTATPTPDRHATTNIKSGPVYMRGGGKVMMKVGNEWVDVTPPEDRQPREFGTGEEEAFVKPELYDALMQLVEDEQKRIDLAELSGQESSYGYAGPHISDVEESYGPYHINLRAGRKNPKTGKAFTRGEAEDVRTSTEYALKELERTGGLGAWNPGAYPFYQEELPKRARTKKYKRGR